MTAPPSWEAELSVVIPAYNEEDGIVPTLQGLRAELPAAEILVVDDGSSDKTSERALSVEGVRVLRHPYNRGYGAALKTAMRCATRRYVGWFDADNEHRVEDLRRMAERIAAEDLVAVVGRRRRPGPSVLRNSGKLAIRLLAITLGVAVGKDLNCGLRIFRRELILRHAAVLPDSYSASLTSTMMLIERGYRFAFHDIDVNPRIGHSKVRILHGFASMALVLRMVMLFAPMRIFFVPGMLMLLAGLAYSLGRALTSGLGVPVLGMLLTTTGLLSAMLGLVADQISQVRLGQLADPSDAEHEELSAPPQLAAAPARILESAAERDDAEPEAAKRRIPEGARRR